MMHIKEILQSRDLDNAARTKALLDAQSKLKDLGAGELTAALETTSDRRVAMKAAGHLSRIAGFSNEKQRISARLIEIADLREAASLLVAHWSADLMDRAIALHHDNPDDVGLAHITYAIAMYDPDRLRPESSRVVLDETRAMLFSGAPDDEVAAMAARYRKGHDRNALERVGFAHTAKAISALQELSPVNSADQELWTASLANAGVFSDGRPSRTRSSFIAHVGHVDASPHHVGGSNPGPVPQCVVCEQPAARVLMLRASELPFDLSNRHDPTFFFYACDCIQENAIVRFTSTGQEVPMGFAHEGPASTAAFAGEHSLILMPHPNQRGYGDTTTAGLGQHQVGGSPPWLHLEGPPHCPGCHVPMLFLAAIDSGLTSFEKLPWKGKLFGFWCDACSISWTRRQT